MIKPLERDDVSLTRRDCPGVFAVKERCAARSGATRKDRDADQRARPGNRTAAGPFWRMAASLVGHDAFCIALSSFLALRHNPLRHGGSNSRHHALRSLLAFALIAAGPSVDDQATSVVRALLKQDIAVATTGYRLATANVDLCAEHMVESGMLIETLGQYGAAFRPAARQVLGLRDGPTVALVVAGSPAERAGLKPGDVLVDAAGVPFAAAPPASAEGRFGVVEAAMTALDAALTDGKVRLTIARNGQRLTVDLIGITACKARFQLVPGDYADAVANGTWVQLSTRMAGFATTPDELAAILAHELAHNALGHRKAKAKVQRMQELQADRLMPYLMARAGFDPRAAVTLWRRFEARRLGGLFPSATHPSWSDRVRAVEIERARIAGLVSRGDAILPPDDLKLQ